MPNEMRTPEKIAADIIAGLDLAGGTMYEAFRSGWLNGNDVERLLTRAASEAIAERPLQVGDLVENVEQPELDYRRVFAVIGDDRILLDFQRQAFEMNERPRLLHMSNYRRVQR